MHAFPDQDASDVLAVDEEMDEKPPVFVALTRLIGTELHPAGLDESFETVPGQLAEPPLGIALGAIDLAASMPRRR